MRVMSWSRQYTNEIFDDKEHHMPNNSLELDKIAGKIVESGDVEQLKRAIGYTASYTT